MSINLAHKKTLIIVYFLSVLVHLDFTPNLAPFLVCIKFDDFIDLSLNVPPTYAKNGLLKVQRKDMGLVEKRKTYPLTEMAQI